MGFPFQFEVNGKYYKLKAGHYLELKIIDDSIRIDMQDKRWVNNGNSEPSCKADTNVYVRVFWGWKTDEKNKLRCIAEAICKSCFDEYKQKCKRNWLNNNGGIQCYGTTTSSGIRVSFIRKRPFVTFAILPEPVRMFPSKRPSK